MDFRPTELQRELAAATRDLLTRLCPPSVVRTAGDKPSDRPDRLCGALAGLGLPGALAPRDVGGLALTVSDVLPALVETGRAAVPAPIAETALVAVPLLVAVGGQQELLAAIAAGRTVLTAAPAGEPVPWAATSGQVLLIGDGVELMTATGADTLASVDRSRPLSRIAPTGPALTTDPGFTAAARLRGALGAAAQLLGLAHRQLDLTVEYVAQRHQFGVPVGSFQAVKHQLADALLALRFVEPVVRRAGLSLDERAGSAGRDVAMAKAMASDAAELVSRTAIQCHGAMGYTDEYDLQLYAKRTWALAAAWGTAAEHRDAFGDALGLPTERKRLPL